ncbi:hypothetical protein [Virgibacillus ndiopensis]|nr:hypothetical protein [Virgibacillus ndiopensis]
MVYNEELYKSIAEARIEKIKKMTYGNNKNRNKKWNYVNRRKKKRTP